MVDYCEALKDWKDLSQQEKYDVLTELTDRAANEFGLDPPDYALGAQPDDPAIPLDESLAPSWYDPATHTIGFNPGALDQQGAQENLSHAGHEFAHATFDQMFPDDIGAGDEKAAADSEWAADTFGDSYADDIADTCDDPPVDSPYDDDVPDDSGEGGDGEGDVEEEGDGDGGSTRKPWSMPDDKKDEQLGGAGADDAQDDEDG